MLKARPIIERITQPIIRRGVANRITGGGGGGLSKLSLNTRVCVVGDSMTYQGADTVFSGYLMHLIRNASGRFYYPKTLNKGVAATVVGGNMGISGQNTQQYVDRKANIVTGVGNGVLIIGGVENNLAAGISVADAILDIDEIITAVGAVRIFVTPVAPTKTILYNNGPTGLAYKSIFDAYYADHPDPRVFLLPNTWAGMTLALDGVNPGAHSYDAVHQNPLGHLVQALNMWGDLAEHFATGDAYACYPSGELMGTSGDFAGTGGTANGMGQVATSWTLTNSTGATVVAAVADGGIDGRRSQVLTISGTPSANSRVRLRRSAPHVYETGDEFVGISTLKVSNAAGNGEATGLRGFEQSVYFNQGRWFSQGYNNGSGLLEDATPFQGIVRTFPVPVSAGGSTVTVDFDIQLVTGSACDVRIEMAGARLFNITDLGLV